MRILVAEDDPRTRAGLKEILEAEGFQVTAAGDGLEALAAFELDRADFVCLDIMMPGMDGYELCRRLRSLSPTVPIIFISAKGEELDKVVGLELGADDFIVKPFGVKEVVARVRAVARRFLAASGTAGTASFRMGDLEVFPAELRARRGEAAIDLSLRDVKILDLLHANRGKVLDRNTIFNRCWGIDYFPNSRTLDQQISQLRKRIEVDPRSPRIIRTVHGIGYRYDG
ncbi:MAG: response regulator transcription factor [Planctomycetes bacterium]|nr:response regulator transcription factor [Planctomycetota bacterium]